MPGHVAFSPSPEPQEYPATPALVRGYKYAHDQMLEALAAMDELAKGAPPNQLRLSHTRLRITRAGTESRAAFHKIALALSNHPSPSARRSVDTLEHLHAELRSLAKHHLATWPHAQAHEDWTGYCQASAQVRSRWRETIARERELLYPLL